MKKPLKIRVNYCRKKYEIHVDPCFMYILFKYICLQMCMDLSLARKCVLRGRVCVCVCAWGAPPFPRRRRRRASYSVGVRPRALDIASHVSPGSRTRTALSGHTR